MFTVFTSEFNNETNEMNRRTYRCTELHEAKQKWDEIIYRITRFTLRNSIFDAIIMDTEGDIFGEIELKVDSIGKVKIIYQSEGK